MSRDKQIEEMARDMCKLPMECHECHRLGNYECKAKRYAERAIDKGYRKASEVAREIFKEIEKCTIQKVVRDGEVIFDSTEQFAKIKKKYIGEDINVLTNTEDEG